MGECGTDLSAWPSAKHFTSWLSLAPHNKISGGKVLSARTRRSGSRAAALLRLAAVAVGRTATALGAFYRRLAARVGKKPGLLRRNGGPRGLFDRLFGVDPSVANEDVLGTIPQALYLMNNPQLHNAMRGGGNSVLGQILAANPKNNRAAWIRSIGGEFHWTACRIAPGLFASNGG